MWPVRPNALRNATANTYDLYEGIRAIGPTHRLQLHEREDAAHKCAFAFGRYQRLCQHATKGRLACNTHCISVVTIDDVDPSDFTGHHDFLRACGWHEQRVQQLTLIIAITASSWCWSCSTWRLCVAAACAPRMRRDATCTCYRQSTQDCEQVSRRGRPTTRRETAAGRCRHRTLAEVLFARSDADGAP